MFIREEISEVVRLAAEDFRSVLADTPILVNYFKDFFSEKKVIENELRKRNVSAEYSEAVRAYINTQRPEFWSKLISNIRADYEDDISLLTDEIRSLVKNSHVRALSEVSDDDHRIARHREMNYAVRRYCSNLILPDTCCSFVGRKHPSPISQSNEMHTVFIPVSPTSFIHGWREDEILPEQETLRRILSSCSYKNFLSQSDNQNDRRLAKRIGRNAKMVARSDIKSLAREALTRSASKRLSELS